MSSVDERIVEMRFDNAQFERGVRESLKTLDKLKLGLDLDASAKSLNNLEKSVSGFTMKNIGDSAVRTAESFSLLYRIGSSFLDKLADSAVNAGLKMVKALSIDNLSAGFNKYEQQTKAVQTILNNVTGSTMEDAEALIHKLMWYTDETSYSFDSMITNIGKFTSAGIDLDTAAKSMIGIANACGLAGVETSQASHAMDGFSKSMAAGYMSYQNWSWLKTAGLDTKIFKEQLIEAGLATGKLTKKTSRNGETIIKTLKGTNVTYANLTETLNEKWLDQATMNTALAAFADYTEEIFQIAEREGITASEAMEKYSRDTGSLGEKSFKAAQEARTFSDAIASVKDAVSSKVAAGADLIFGNYQESKKTWTYLANYLWDIFAAPLDSINGALKEWKNNGGFGDLFSDNEDDLGAFYLYFEEFYKYVEAAQELADLNLFGAEEGEISPFAQKMLDLTSKIKTAAQAFEVTNEKIEKFKHTITNIFSVLRSGLKIVSAIGTIIGKTFNLFKEGFGEILPDLNKSIDDGIQNFAEFADKIKQAADEFEYSEETVSRVKTIFRGAFTVISYGVRIFKALGTALLSIGDKAKPAFEKLGKVFDSLLPYIGQLFEFVDKQITRFEEWAESVDLLATVWGLLGKAFQKGSEWFQKGKEIFKRLFDGLADGIKELTGFDLRSITWENVLSFLERVGETLGKVIPLLWEGAQAFGSFIAGIGVSAYTTIGNKLSELGVDIQTVWDGIKSSTTTAKSFFGTLKKDAENGTVSLIDYIKNLKILSRIQTIMEKGKNKLSKIFENFSMGGTIVGALGASLIPMNLAFADTALKIGSFIGAITGVGTALKKFVDSMRKAKMLKAVVFAFVAALIAITAAIGYLTYVAKQEGGIEALKTATTAIASIIGMLTIFALIIGIFSKIKGGAAFDAVLLSFAAFFGGLAALLFVLPKVESINIENYIGVFGAIAVLILEMVAAAVIANALTGGFGGGIWQIIAFAGAIYILVLALERIDNLSIKWGTLEETLNRLTPVLAMIIGFSILAISAGSMRIRGILAFIGFIYALKLLMDALQSLGEIKNADNISKVLTPITWLIVAIGVILFAFKWLDSQTVGPPKPSAIMNLGITILAIAAAFAITIYALKMLKDLKIDTGMLITIGIMAAVYAAFMLLAAWAGKGKVGNAGLAALALASAILITVAALRLLNNVKIDSNILWTIAGIAAVFAALIILISIFGKKGGGAGMAAKSILAIAIAVSLLAIVIAALSYLPNENMSKFIVIAVMMAVIIAALAVVFLAVSRMPAKGIIGPMIMIMLLIAELTAVMWVLSKIPDPTGVLMLLGGMIAVISILSLLMGWMGTWKSVNSGSILIAAAAIVVASIAFLLLGTALEPLAKFSWDSLIGAAGALAIGIIALAVALSILGKVSGWALVGAAALIVAAAAATAFALAIMAITDAINAWNDTPTNYTADWLGGVADALRGGAKKIDDAATETDKANAHAEAAVENSGNIGRDGGGGRGRQGRGHEARENIQLTGSDETLIGGNGVPEEFRRMAVPVETEIEPTVDTTPTARRSFWGTLLDSGASLFNNPEAIAAASGETGVGQLPPSWQNATAGWWGDLADNIGAQGIESGLATTIQDTVTSQFGSGLQGVDVTAAFNQYLGGNMENAGTNQILAYATGLSNPAGIEQVNQQAAMIEAGAVENISKGVSEATTAGENLVQGYINGIESLADAAAAAAGAVAAGAVAAMNEAQASGSPSRLTFQSGRWFDEGYYNAIRQYAGASREAAYVMGQDTVAALGEGLKAMDSIANGSVTVTPSVRPVMDISSIQNGSRSIDTMFATRQAMYANIADAERRNGSDMTILVGVANAILTAVNSGHDLYIDDHKLIGRINRGLGRL